VFIDFNQGCGIQAKVRKQTVNLSDVMRNFDMM